MTSATSDPLRRRPRQRPALPPAALGALQAAQYLGVSRTFFFEHLRQLLPVVDLRRPGGQKPMWRWLPADLDHFLAARRTDLPE